MNDFNKANDFVDEYTVIYDGEPVLKLNHRLCDKQGICPDGLSQLKAKHVHRLFIEEVMQVIVEISKDDEEYSEEYERVMRRLFSHWITNQFQLQSLWGFPQDASYHNSYVLPGCTCTNKLDNIDALGTKYRWHNDGDVCPYHHPQFLTTTQE